MCVCVCVLLLLLGLYFFVYSILAFFCTAIHLIMEYLKHSYIDQTRVEDLICVVLCCVVGLCYTSIIMSYRDFHPMDDADIERVSRLQDKRTPLFDYALDGTYYLEHKVNIPRPLVPNYGLPGKERTRHTLSEILT